MNKVTEKNVPAKNEQKPEKKSISPTKVLPVKDIKLGKKSPSMKFFTKVPISANSTEVVIKLEEKSVSPKKVG